MNRLSIVSLLGLLLATSCTHPQAPQTEVAPNGTAIVEFVAADFQPRLLMAQPNTIQGFDLIPPGDLERTPRDYTAVRVTLRGTGQAKATLAIVDILNREHKSDTIELRRDQQSDLTVSMDQVGRPVSMLRSVRLHAEGQPLQVLDLRISCAAEMLPQPDVVVRGPLDHSSIQAALDSLPQNGGVVYIPAGIYVFTDQVAIPRDNVTIYGDGAATVLQGTWYEAKALLRAENRKNLRFTRLNLRSLPITEFRGYSEAQHARVPEDAGRPSVLSRGIELANCSSVRVDRCEIQLFGHAGVIFYGGTDNLVDHCFLHENFRYGYGYGVATPGTKELYIENNNFENHRHGIAGNAGGASYIARFNRLVKYANVFASWNQSPDGINQLRSFEIDAHAGCSWIYAHDNFVAMYGAVQMSRAAQMRGNPGWLYRNVFENCAVGIGAGGNSDDVWAWDNVSDSPDTLYHSTATGSIHFDQKPPDFKEIPYPHALNRLGWWPGANDNGGTIVNPCTQFAGPGDAPVLVSVTQAD